MATKIIQFFFIIPLLLILYYFFNNTADENMPKSEESLAIVYLLDSAASFSEYKLAISSTRCYQQRHHHRYALFVLSASPIDSDGMVGQNLRPNGFIRAYLVKSVEDFLTADGVCAHSDFLFRRHCLVAMWMAEHPHIQWLLVLSGDIGVVNPNHAIEEYIVDSGGNSELIFIDRIASSEIMVDGYLAKNTPFVRSFLHFWANYYYQLPASVHGADNGAIHAVFMEKYAEKSDRKNCQYLWEKSKNVGDLNNFTVCVRHFIDAKMAPDRTVDNGRIKVLAKSRGWMRAGCVSGTRFSHRDFMFYGWKQLTLDKPSLCPWTNPFEPNQNFADAKQCQNGAPWRYKPEFGEQPDDLIREQLERKMDEMDEERVMILIQLGLYNGI